MICFIIELFDRIGPIKKEIDEMINIFKNYKNNITIIITKTDRRSNFNEKEAKLIKKDIEKFFKIKNVIFTHEKSNGYAICDELNDFQLKMKNIQSVSIKIDSIVKNTSFISIPEIEQKMELYQNKFNTILDDHNNELKRHKENDLRLAIYFSLKSWKRKCLDEYGKAIENINFQETIEDEDEIEEDDDEKELEQLSIAIMQFDGALQNKFEDFRKNVENDLEVKIASYNGDYNKFKKCPHCGEIWFKIIGCDNMVCGQRTTLQDKIKGRWKNYEVSYDYNTRRFTIKSTEHENNYSGEDKVQKGLTEEEKKLNPKRVLEGKSEIKPAGCGNQLNWNEMEDYTEYSLKELKLNSLGDEYYNDSLQYYDNKLGQYK